MATTQRWFSARAQLLVLVEGTGAAHVAESTFVFRSSDWPHALERALQLGHESEREYTNANGARVRWRLCAILTLDMIKGDEIDGAEVHFNMREATQDLQVPFDATCHPEQSHPSQTL